ncbi:MAG: UDP-glucose 6-dehydrogenase [Chlamydiae bacterium]|nr:UDP-glucose 6-dehydrogenase [Chlamydiota bacterium]
MHVCVVGLGYVGLVTACCFAKMGHHVIGLDTDRAKVQALQQGKLPFFETGLDTLLEEVLLKSRLTFVDDYTQALQTTTMIFVCVPTPMQACGNCDLSFVFDSVEKFIKKMQNPSLIIIKSTIPPGTCRQIKKQMQMILEKEGFLKDFDIISNPEFLSQGTAIENCLNPDRIIIGVENKESQSKMLAFYQRIHGKNVKILIMPYSSAEIVKYAANAMLAMRISYMNEIAHLAEYCDADIEKIALGIGTDNRIGHHHLEAGLGFGGSCFPKDLSALEKMYENYIEPSKILSSIREVNHLCHQRLIKKMEDYYQTKSFGDFTFAILGFSFKPNTDDIRYSPTIELVRYLSSKRAKIHIYDPICYKKMLHFYSSKKRIKPCSTIEQATNNADGVILCTKWPEFQNINFQKMIDNLCRKVIFDGRNYLRNKVEDLDVDYIGIGYKKLKNLKLAHV